MFCPFAHKSNFKFIMSLLVYSTSKNYYSSSIVHQRSSLYIMMIYVYVDWSLHHCHCYSIREYKYGELLVDTDIKQDKTVAKVLQSTLHNVMALSWGVNPHTGHDGDPGRNRFGG